MNIFICTFYIITIFFFNTNFNILLKGVFYVPFVIYFILFKYIPIYTKKKKLSKNLFICVNNNYNIYGTSPLSLFLGQKNH